MAKLPQMNQNMAETFADWLAGKHPKEWFRQAQGVPDKVFVVMPEIPTGLYQVPDNLQGKTRVKPRTKSAEDQVGPKKPLTAKQKALREAAELAAAASSERAVAH